MFRIHHKKHAIGYLLFLCVKNFLKWLGISGNDWSLQLSATYINFIILPIMYYSNWKLFPLLVPKATSHPKRIAACFGEGRLGNQVYIQFFIPLYCYKMKTDARFTSSSLKKIVNGNDETLKCTFSKIWNFILCKVATICSVPWRKSVVWAI